MTHPIVVVIVTAMGLQTATDSARVEFGQKSVLARFEDTEVAKAFNIISRWPQFGLLYWMIARKLAKSKPAGILADMGCGLGRLVTLIAQEDSSLRVLGINAADEMIQALKVNAAALGLSEWVEFHKGNVSSLFFLLAARFCSSSRGARYTSAGQRTARIAPVTRYAC